MKIVIDGLGKMGMQIAEKLVGAKYEVIAHNRSPQKVDQAKEFGALPAYTKEEAVKLIGDGVGIVWIMLPSDVVDDEIDIWLKLLKKSDIIIDGGNSDFRRDKERYKKINNAGMQSLDVGTSGGIGGLEKGFCMMVGGDEAAYKTGEPILKSLSLPSGGYHYFGEPGSGHYVKMVHNAIEYGMMESIAEGFNFLKDGPYKNIDLGAAANVWQNGSIIASSLNGLTAEALNENPNLDGIDGYVSENGEARWTLESAREEGIEMPSIQASLDVRVASQNGKTSFATKLLAAMRNKFGGHAINKSS